MNRAILSLGAPQVVDDFLQVGLHRALERSHICIDRFRNCLLRVFQIGPRIFFLLEVDDVLGLVAGLDLAIILLLAWTLARGWMGT